MKTENTNEQQPPQQENNNSNLEKVLREQIQKVDVIENVKTHAFPLARIKYIMKSDPDVQMIAAESPLLLSKACEMFIMDLTTRSQLHADHNNRRLIQKSDIYNVVAETVHFDFLADVFLPKEDEPERVEYGYLVNPYKPGGVVPGMVIGTPVVCGSGMHVEAQALLPGPSTVVASDGEKDGAEKNEV